MRLKVSESQVRRLIKLNRLKAINVGTGTKRKDYRIREKDIENME